MTAYILDAFAWIEYLIGSEKGDKVKKLIENGANEIFTSLVTLAEVVSVTEREKRDSGAVYYHMLMLSKFTGLSPEFSQEAGSTHAKTKKKMRNFGLADAFVLTAAKKLGATIVTGDSHFRRLHKVVLI